MTKRQTTAEHRRLAEEARRARNWKRWGPYLSERQWGTVREDYSADGDAWRYFPHDHARSRAYRWGEDGLLGWTDRECRLCFAIALWNGRDPILKERLFGVTNPQGNHGEDVKELYYYLDATPTNTYAKGLYRYSQAAFPYEDLVEVNAARGKGQPEYEITDTGAFDGDRFFDVTVEYAKAGPNDTLIRITARNRGPEAATLHLFPTLWFRNTWVWGCEHEGCTVKPSLWLAEPGRIDSEHESLGRFTCFVGDGPAPGSTRGSEPPELLFTDNHTNTQRLFGLEGGGKFAKDAFHDAVVRGDRSRMNPKPFGTKVAAWHRLDLPPGGEAVVKLRLCETATIPRTPLGRGFDDTFRRRIEEADAFYDAVLPAELTGHARSVSRQAYAGLLWSRQFYHYIVTSWLTGDPHMPPPPVGRGAIRNGDWPHVYSRDLLSMPDKWEYPWFAAWDLAFHMLPMARIDPYFAKSQLELLLREWYMHPNGQLPAYEYQFSDVNPPVHAYACWRTYKVCAPRGQRDRRFLASTFQKLLLNFTWWVNRKDAAGRHLFAGGFLGLDNIGPFDRSRPLAEGVQLTQADGTAWMAFFCLTMLEIALELADGQPEYEDLASKFFEHFVAIVDAMNSLGGTGLWDEHDGFYYDQLEFDHEEHYVRVRSLVGLIPLIAVGTIDRRRFERLPGFAKRTRWFLKHRQDLARYVSFLEAGEDGGSDRYLLAVPSRERLQRVLRCMLDEDEFLSPFGIRSLSKRHEREPYRLDIHGVVHEVRYQPGESRSELFGGNSNWRGPIWFPLNHLLIEALQRYHHAYGQSFKVECPTGSGRWMTLDDVARELQRRLASLFDPDRLRQNIRLGHDVDQDLVLFHEYFHAETGEGLGASHQTGWTSLVTSCFEDLCRACEHDSMWAS